MKHNPRLKKPLLYSIIILCWFTSLSLFAQSEIKTLKISNNKNMSLIFPSPIKQAIVGSANYNFSFNTNEESKLGILKAIPGNESNLLVITSNDNIYSFLLKYEKDIKELIYYVKETDKSGNINSKTIIVDELEKPLEVEPSETSKAKQITENDYYDEKETFENDEEFLKFKTDKLYTINKALYLKKFSSYVNNKDPFFKRYFTVTDNVSLSLRNVVFNNNETYFFLTLENKGILDFDVNYINLYITSHNKKKRSSAQAMKYEPIYAFNLPKKVNSFHTSNFVLVYNKISIGSKKAVIIDVNELQGERNLKLEISHSDINNPNSINDYN